MRRIVILLLAGAACMPQRRPSHPQATPRWVSVRFDSSRTLRIVPSLIAPADTQTISGVRGLGGEVLEWGRDTLLMRPTYLMIRINAEGRAVDVAVRRRSWDATTIPNLVLVTTDSGAMLSTYEFPKTSRERFGEEVTAFAIPMLVFWPFLGLLLRWPH